MEIRYYETDQGNVAKDSAGNWRRFNTKTGKFGKFSLAPPPNAPEHIWRQPQVESPPPLYQRQQRHADWINASIVILVVALVSVLVIVFASNNNKLTSEVTVNDPFIKAAPPGHRFVGATKGRDGPDCEARNGRIVPDERAEPIWTGRGWAIPNRCTAD